MKILLTIITQLRQNLAAKLVFPGTTNDLIQKKNYEIIQDQAI